MIKIPKNIQKLQPYVAGKPIEELARERNLKKIVKLASNENPLGSSPKAIDAIKKHLNELHRYTNPSAYKLVNAIARHFNKRPEQIVTGSGSDSLLQYIITAFSDEDNEILTSEGTFTGWYVNASKYGRKSVLVPLRDFHYDLDGIVSCITQKTKIIYLANPNNPTGTIFTSNEFENFLTKVTSNVLVVLDEAYTVYAESNPDYPNGLNYERDNLIVLRTLSKAYGLAGLRIGFGVGPKELIKELYKVKLPFEPNHLAQEAAIAAFNDNEFLEKTIKLNSSSLSKMTKKFDKLGIRHVPTSANFILLIFPTEEFAAEFCNRCLEKGLILRHVKTFGIPNGVRINSGTEEETEFALNIISEIYPLLTEKFSSL
jgi:histidinol-phosphate aminotransferase